MQKSVIDKPKIVSNNQNALLESMKLEEKEEKERNFNKIRKQFIKWQYEDLTYQ